MLGILRFLAFLVAVLAWYSLQLKWTQISESLKKRGRDRVAVEIVLMKDLIAFFAFVYLLSGFWNWKLMAVMLAAVHLGPLTAWFLNNAFGRDHKIFERRGYVIGYEIGNQDQPLVRVPLQISRAAVFIYPVVMAFFYFRHSWGSPILQAQAIKYTLLLLIISGYLFMSLLAPKMMAYANVDDETRQNVFFTQIGSFIPIGVYLAIGAAAFGITQDSIRLDVLGVPGRTLSLELLGILFAFFVVTTLIPALVGSQRTRIRELELQERVRDIVSEIERVLGAPDKSVYVTKLEAVISYTEALLQQFMAEEPFIARLVNIGREPDKATDDEKRVKGAMDVTARMDLRARHVDALVRLQNELNEIIADLKKRDDSHIEDAAAKWGKRYEARKAELTEKIEELTNRKPILAAGLGSGLLLIASGILGEVAKSAWGLVAGVK